MAVPKRPWVEREEALRLLLDAVAPLPAEEVPLEAAAGRWLASPVRADRDLPPFDRSAMDGYAVRAADLTDEAGRTQRVGGVVPAGTWPETGPGPGEVFEIYTGAPLPPDTDTVVPIEETTREGERVRFHGPVRAGRHVAPAGGIARRGDVLLAPGSRLGPAQIALLATVGCDPVMVGRRPRVRLAATGDELVDHREIPDRAGVRDSSTPMLTTQLDEGGFEVAAAERLADDPAAVDAFLSAASAEAEVVLLTGGVSAGARDHVEEVLLARGAELLFDAVRLKPGKPLTAARLGEALVLGLPGNPVSSFAAVRLFVLPVLRRLAGAAEPGPRFRQAELTEEVSNPGQRPELRPVRLRVEGGPLLAEPVPYRGSGDVAGLALGDALMLVPEGGTTPAGTRLPVLDHRDPSEGGVRP
jgi:molybdopterin molybdotransferase